MMGLPLAFLAPAALVGLAVLPIIWFLIRITPPRPLRTPFPPLKLILDIKPKDETPARTPWWLLALRLAIAACIVLAMAGPIWNPPALNGDSDKPLLVLLDDGWAAAPAWSKRIAYAISAIEAAGLRSAPSAVLALSEGAIAPALSETQQAIERLRAKKPVSYTPKRLAAAPAVEAFIAAHQGAQIIWLADGLEMGDARAFAERIAQKTPALEIIGDNHFARALAGPRNDAGALVVRVLRAGAGQGQDAPDLVRAFDLKGQSLGDAIVASGGSEGLAKFDLPVELRNEIARLELMGEHSAGAVALLDDRWKRRRVGIVSGATADLAQPLLAPNFYLARALGPFADIREARPGADDPIGALIEEGVNVLILADIAVTPGAQREKLDAFLDRGGVVIRFAGSRLAASSDDLAPVTLRRGGRTLGGALSWETPKKMAPFDRTSPFHGLQAAQEATISRQVLAEPEPGLPSRTWAQLADQTPLVTAERRGRGLLVLFHITADTTWSNLPLSGLFPEMLRKIIALSGEPAPAPAEDETTAGRQSAKAEQLAPTRMLDGFGALGAPSIGARPITADFQGPPSADHPPGFYGPADAQIAINTLTPDAMLQAADFSGLPVRKAELQEAAPLDLRLPLMTAVFLLFVADSLASLWLSGGFTRRVRAAPVAMAFLVGAALMLAPSSKPAQAQSAPTVFAQQSKSAPTQQPPKLPSKEPHTEISKRDLAAALQTRLAYVITGDARVDETSRSGLAAVSRTLAQRTSLAPADPVGVDPARDELAFYPLLYWPIVATRPQPPPLAVQKIAAFMKQGGTIVFDTRDALTKREGGEPSPEALWLRKLLTGVDVPELELVPRDHVVTKTFYLLNSFVGRTANGQTWIEALPPEPADGAPRPARAGDSVSPIIIVSNDLAAAWASDNVGDPLYPLIPGGERQREMALRGGVNIVLYTLTGNYKADQVHVRDLLNRLGH